MKLWEGTKIHRLVPRRGQLQSSCTEGLLQTTKKKCAGVKFSSSNLCWMHLSQASQPSVVVKHTWLSRYASADWDAPTRCVETCVTWNCHRKRWCIAGVASGYTRFQRKSDHRMWLEPDHRGAAVLLSHQLPVKQLRFPMHTQQASVNAFTLV